MGGKEPSGTTGEGTGMLERASDILVNVYLVVGVATFATVALFCGAYGIADAFRPCLTVRRDGTPSEKVDSFHLRSWVLGLAVPTYRMTALRGLGRVLLCVALAIASGGVAFLLGMGLA